MQFFLTFSLKIDKQKCSFHHCTEKRIGVKSCLDNETAPLLLTVHSKQPERSYTSNDSL